MGPPDDVAAFGRAVHVQLATLLPDNLVEVWFVGSVVLGGYVAGESDVDIAAVCTQTMRDELKTAVADRVWETTEACPARGLELTIYRADMVALPRSGAAFEVNVNGGPRMERVVHRSAADEPGFWYLLDRAIAHRRGLAISGPPASEVFCDVPRPMLLDAMTQSMRWHREHERATLYSVLNAGRAWRYAVDDVLGSKLEGAEWARDRWPSPELVDAAVDLRRGRPAELDADAVDGFLRHVEEVLESAR